MRYKALSATTVAVLLCGTTSPSMAKTLETNQIFSQYVRACLSLADGSVRFYIPKSVHTKTSGPLSTPCDPATEIEVLFTLPPEMTWNMQNNGNGGSGPEGPAGPPGPPGPTGPAGPPGSPG